MAKAVFSLSSSRTGVCQNPDAKSNVENHLHPPKALTVSSILGMGYESLMVTAFSLL